MKKITKKLILLLLITIMLLQSFSPIISAANDQKASHSASDSYATVTKSAAWTNADKTEAEITINVNTVKPKSVGASNIDVIYLIDKSNTAGREYEGLPYKTMIQVATENLPYFVKGDYANKGNRVAIAGFSSSLFLFNKSGGSVYAYNRNSPNYPSEAEKDIFEKLTKNSEGKWFTTEAETKTPIKAIKASRAGTNTNVDYGLLYAKYLLKNRSDKTRKSYVIFVTDGDPYPYTDAERKKAAKLYYQDKIGNIFYSDISKHLRDTYGTEFYVIIVDTGRKHDDAWVDITGGYKVGSSRIQIVSNKNVKESFKSLYQEINENIANDAKNKETTSNVSSMVVTDYINTSLFKFNGDSAKVVCVPSIGTASIDVNSGKVTWNLGSNLPYGTGGTLKIKIKLKDENKEGWLNTNSESPADDRCVFNHNKGTVKVRTPWIYRELPKYTVTEKWVDKATNKDIVAATNSSVKKNATYKTNKKDLTSNGYRYNSSTPAESSIKITANTTIVHYYDKIPMVQITEKYVDIDTNTSINPSKDKVTKIEKNKTYSGKVENFSGYRYEYTNPTNYTNITVGNNITITHYYKKVFNLTVKYINDETGKEMRKNKESNVPRNTVWPTSGTLKDKYAIYDDPSTTINDITSYFGPGYELRKIVVDGKTYNIDNMPKTINMTADKVIEFHYGLKPADLVVRTFVVDRTDGQLDVKSIAQKGQVKKTIKLEKEEKISAPTKPTTTSVCIGHVVEITNNPNPMTIDKINNANKETTAKVKISEGKTIAYVDFIFLEEKYTLSVGYRDVENKEPIKENIKLQGSSGNSENTITPVVNKKYLKNEVVTLTTPDQIFLPNGAEYKFQKRLDNGIENTKNATVAMNGKKEVIYEYKLQTIPVTIHYKDAITGKPIASPYGPIQVIPNQTTEPIEKNIPDEYDFVKRDDGKGRNEPIGPITPGSKTEYTFYYWKNPENPTEEDVLPVVSYPKAKAKDNRIINGKPAVILGENITVTIPNGGTHTQMENELGVVPPEGGWNAKYAQVEYLRASCDVYYKGKLYKKDTPFKVAERADIEKGDVMAELFIPEWVPEGEYSAEAIVISKIKTINDIISLLSKWKASNRLYEDIGARGTALFNVKGKVYDFTITNLIEDKYWPGSLYDVEREYKANLNQTNNAIGVLPIGQGTTTQQQQKYNHGIALGSTFFFNVNTIGVKNQAISIKPKFMFVTKDGAVKNVTLYSKNGNTYEEISETQTIQLQTQLNNEYKKDRTNLGLEMQKAFAIEGFKDLQTNYKYNIGNYSRLHIDKTQRVPFAEYITEILKDNSINANIKNIYSGMSESEKNDVLKSACHWYGEYRLPSSTIVMEGNSKPGAGTQYKDGFIIVMFQIVTQDQENVATHTENTYLVYNKQPIGDQWKNEGGTAEGKEIALTMPRLMAGGAEKKVNVKVSEGYYPVAIYDVAVRASGNYETAGTH